MDSRGFVLDFSPIVAPNSNLLRETIFHSRRARHQPLPCGPTKTAAFVEVIGLPNWKLPFTLHADATDANTLATGSVLTQEMEARDAGIGYASKGFSRTERNSHPTAWVSWVCCTHWTTSRYTSNIAILLRSRTVQHSCGCSPAKTSFRICIGGHCG